MNFNNNHGLNVETYALLTKKIQVSSSTTDGKIGNLANLETANKSNLVEAINELVEGTVGGVHYIGTTTTAITDGATTNPITIRGESVTATQGDMVSYGSGEFIFDGSIWNEIGDLTGLGSMAYEDAGDYLALSGGTVTGQTNFTRGFNASLADSSSGTPVPTSAYIKTDTAISGKEAVMGSASTRLTGTQRESTITVAEGNAQVYTIETNPSDTNIKTEVKVDVNRTISLQVIKDLLTENAALTNLTIKPDEVSLEFHINGQTYQYTVGTGDLTTVAPNSDNAIIPSIIEIGKRVDVMDGGTDSSTYITTLSVSDTMSTIDLDDTFGFVYLKNNGDEPCYVSETNNVGDGVEGSIIIQANSTTILSGGVSTLYAICDTGKTTTIDIYAQNNTNNPFGAY